MDRAEPEVPLRFAAVVTDAGPLPAWVHSLATALGPTAGALPEVSGQPVAVAPARTPTLAANASWAARLDAWRGVRAVSIASVGQVDRRPTPPGPANGPVLWLVEPPARDAVEGWSLRVDGFPAAAVASAVLAALQAGRGEVAIDAVPIGCTRVAAAALRWHCALSEHSYSRSVDWVTDKLVSLAKRLPGAAAGREDAGPDAGGLARPPWPASASRSVVRHALHRAARQVLAREQWSIRVHPHADPDHLAPSGPAIDLTPPADRYWADPFVSRRDGRLWVFFEELRVAHPLGRLCAVAVDASGRCSAPMTVLEAAGHLSYPQVFEHAGAWYLLPESADRRQVLLYRSTHWPDGWEPVAELLGDQRLVDPTLLHRDGVWWMLGAGADTSEGCVRDALCVYRAERLTGPFRALGRNPLRVDAALSRPAGPCFEWQGRWHRPVQDCRGRYGRAVHLMRIDDIGPAGLQETRVATLASVPGDGTEAVHTYCRRDGALAVDWLRWRARWPGLPTAAAPSLSFRPAA